MLCTVCHQREATIHLTQIVEGNSTTSDLCEVCGQGVVGLATTTKGHQQATTPRRMQEALERIVAGDQRYALEAYRFTLEGCYHAFAKRCASPPSEMGAHLSAAELLEVLREHALATYGSRAKATLNAWGVHRCEDFGEIVFNLIKAGLLTKRPEDTKADFQGRYDFETAFTLRAKPRRPPPS